MKFFVREVEHTDFVGLDPIRRSACRVLQTFRSDLCHSALPQAWARTHPFTGGLAGRSVSLPQPACSELQSSRKRTSRNKTRPWHPSLAGRAAPAAASLQISIGNWPATSEIVCRAPGSFLNNLGPLPLIVVGGVVLWGLVRSGFIWKSVVTIKVPEVLCCCYDCGLSVF